MGLEGVYLYYGYKIKAVDLKGLYENDYKNIQIKEYSDSYKKKGKEYKYKFDPYSFGEYVSNIFAKLDAKDIVATTLPCCTYKKDGYWIIGKKIDYIDAFDLCSITLPTSDDLKLIDPVLEKLVADSDLSKIISSDTIPKIYAIGDDCRSCT